MTDLIFILDRSGSMKKQAKTTIKEYNSYIENMESNELIKKLNRKKLFKYFLLTLLILITLLWGFKMYRLNQLYEEAKSETHGYITEEIIK